MVAQNYTEMCTFARNPQRADQAPSFATVGENLFVTFLQDVNYTAFVQAWYNQNENYNFQFNNCSAACDEYRQVIYTCIDSLQAICNVDAACKVTSMYIAITTVVPTWWKEFG